MGRGPVSDSSPWEPLYQQVGRLFLTVVAAVLVVHTPSHSLTARNPQEALYLFRRQGLSVSRRVGMGRAPSIWTTPVMDFGWFNHSGSDTPSRGV